MEDPKLFQAFLTGVVKREYEGDESITAKFLKEAVFAGAKETTEQEISKWYDNMRDLFARAAHEDYDPAQLESFMKLKRKDLSQVQRDTIVKVWKTQRAKIHEAMQKRCTWDGTLQKMSWRVDVKARTRDQADVNEPVAIVELHINKHPEGKDLARFEVDKAQLASIVQQIQAVESEIERVTSKQRPAVSAQDLFTACSVVALACLTPNRILFIL